MSRTFEILCHDCQVSLWIAQRSAGETRFRLYAGTEPIGRLRDFLFDHQNHRLEFGDDEPFAALDYKSLDPE